MNSARNMKEEETSPALEFSSDSDDDICEDRKEKHRRRRKNLLDMTSQEDEQAATPVSPAAADLRERLLVAAITAQLTKNKAKNEDSDEKSAHSSSVSLRDRLGRLSRDERRELLLRAGVPLGIRGLSTGSQHGSGAESTRSQKSLYSSASFRSAPQRRDSTSSLAMPVRTNRITLHVYDLIAHDTLMQLPWGCVCEIGKCFNEVNSALHAVGTGAYHVGVEINGVEYAYGATSTPGKSGVFSCLPMRSPGYQYRSSVDFGERKLVRQSWVSVRDPLSGKSDFRHVEHYVDGRQVMIEMAKEYMGVDYDILRKNCCTFAYDACIRLGINEDEIPSWFRNLSESGAMTQDMAYATVQPLRQVLSSCEEVDGSFLNEPIVIERGFELIAKRNAANNRDVIFVVDALPSTE